MYITCLHICSHQTQFSGNSAPLNRARVSSTLLWRVCVASLSFQSCSWTAQETAGQEADGPLLRSLLPLPPKANLGVVFTFLITGEGLADRRAITDSPQAWSWERHKHPPLFPECDGSVQLSEGSFPWQNSQDQREILKT